MAQQHGFELKVLNAVEARNATQKRVLFKKLAQHSGGEISDCIVAVWGLAFKPDTDDKREANSITLFEELLDAGAKVRAYDPIAMDEAKRVFPKTWLKQGDVTLARDQYDALRDADALAVVTEWNPFRSPDFHLMRKIMARPVIVDGRNVYDPELMQELGFEYSGIGRGRVYGARTTPPAIHPIRGVSLSQNSFAQRPPMRGLPKLGSGG
jgi:UDPglucose 6-dehydrogenase